MKEKYDILIVDDEYGMREGVRRTLAPYGHNITIAQNGEEAFKFIREMSFDLALLDLKLPDTSGLEILDAIQKKDPLTVCIIITAFATLDTAVDATKRGAFDYLAKPFTTDQLLILVDKALDKRDLLQEAETLRRERDDSLLELYKEKSRFKTIISCMTDGVIVTNKDGEVALFNNAGSRFLKNHIHVKPGTNIKTCAGSDEISGMICRTSDPGCNTEVCGQEIEMDGGVWMANCASLKDEEGEFLGAVTVFRDISEMKKVEKIKSQFVSLVAHELRAPVAAIKGYLDIIVKRAAGDDETVYQNMMNRSIERATGLLELIKDLLDMSRLDTRKIQRNIKPVDMVQALKENISFFKNEIENRGLTVETDYSADSIIARMDPDELNRTITNLLSNAIKYNSDNGRIIITAGRIEDRAYFAIADTGIGMNREDQEHLFEDFFRANNPLTKKQSGTGLGLAITRRMIEANFGRIDVESESGKGSKFTVTLPGVQS